MAPKLTILANNQSGNAEFIPVRDVESLTLFFHDGNGGPPRPLVTATMTGKILKPKTGNEIAAEKYHEDFFRFFDEMEQAMGEAVNG